MPDQERDKTSDSGDPDPAVTAGLESGGGVEPGDTPPMTDSMSGTSGDARSETPNMGPVSGNRTPMFIALGALTLMVLMVAVLVGASFFPSG